MKLLIVITAAAQEKANAIARANFPDAQHTFSIAASADGKAPATHYACGIECGESEEQIRKLVAYVGAACANLADNPAAAWRELGLLPVAVENSL